MEVGLSSNHPQKPVVFDSLSFAKELQAGGYTKKQAETLTSGVVKIIQSDLATKTDMANIQRDIAELRKETKYNIAELHKETKDNIIELSKETRTDIEKSRQELELRIESLRKDTHHGLKEIESRLTLRMTIVMITGISVLSALQNIF